MKEENCARALAATLVTKLPLSHRLTTSDRTLHGCVWYSIYCLDVCGNLMTSTWTLKNGREQVGGLFRHVTSHRDSLSPPFSSECAPEHSSADFGGPTWLVACFITTRLTQHLQQSCVKQEYHGLAMFANALHHGHWIQDFFMSSVVQPHLGNTFWLQNHLKKTAHRCITRNYPHVSVRFLRKGFERLRTVHFLVHEGSQSTMKD